jgi:hypothetical protein
MHPYKTLVPLVMLVAGGAVAQNLVCPTASSASGAQCETFHYHVQLYRPDTKQLVELYGINQFASQSACERARDAQMKRNLSIVDHIRRAQNQPQYEPDRFGPCHCDMTIERSSPNVLGDPERSAQVRMAEDIRLRVRDRLLDSGLQSDSELVRSATAPASAPTALVGGPRIVPIPPSAAASSSMNASDLKPTKATNSSKQSVATDDLPLADITTAVSSIAAAPAPAPASVPVTNGAGSEPATTSVAASSPAPAPLELPTTVVKPEPPVSPPSQAPAPAPEPAASATPAPAASSTDAATTPVDELALDAADSFISYETQRIQNVLKASAAISDEGVKSKIFDACMQRTQLLSNLRALIEGSGVKSRLANAARAAREEADRIALVVKLFGPDIAAHWAPKDASDVILPVAADDDPEKVVRDASGRYSGDQRKQALYALLARTQPTEDQQLWLTTVIESFLR